MTLSMLCSPYFICILFRDVTTVYSRDLRLSGLVDPAK